MSLSANFTYPRSEINIKDESIGSPSVNVIMPLHRPLFPLKAAKGPINVIKWQTGADALKTYGNETFDRTSKFYRGEQLFMNQGLFANQGAFMVRLCDPAATISSAVLECHVTRDIEVPQFERDQFGGIIEDEDGNPIPLMDPDTGLQVINTGVKLGYQIRALDRLAPERIDNILPRTLDVGGVITTVYPVLAFEYGSPGGAGNRSGFRFWYDWSIQDSEILEENQCLTFNFVPVEQPFDGNIPVIIKDIYGSVSSNFAFKPNQTQSSTTKQFSINETIDRVYSNLDNSDILPYTVFAYSDNVKAIGDIVLEYEPNPDGTLVDGWMIDIFSALNTSGRPYLNVTIDSATTVLSSLHTYYLTDGSDGDTSDEMFEELYRQVLRGTLITEIVDTARYPITHLYDVGYTLDTKLAFAEFMVMQKRCKCVMSTQDSSRPFVTMDESLSMASTLLARFRIAPESELYGTAALRAEIFGQSGKLTDRNIHAIVPASYWILTKRAAYQSGQSMTNDIHGNPQSIVNIYREVSFVPSTPQQKQLIYSNNLNYFEYKDMYNWFFADIGTIYNEKSSVLCGSAYTDSCIYAMYAVDQVWSDYAGVTVPFSILSKNVTDDIKAKCNTSFGNLFPDVTATMYQTEDDIQSGDTFHIEIVVMGYDKVRRFKTDIIARRESLAVSS